MTTPLQPSWADIARKHADSKTSDFPSLSGGPQPASNAGQSSWNSNILRQPPSQQQQPIQQRAPQQQQQPQAPPATQQQVQSQQQQQQQQQRVPSGTLSQQSTDQQDEQQAQQPSADQSNGGGDDFPPLSVRTNGESFDHANGQGGVTLQSPDGSQTQGAGQQTQLPFREAPAQQAPIGHPLTQTTSQQVSLSGPHYVISIANDTISINRRQYWPPRISPHHQPAVLNAMQTCPSRSNGDSKPCQPHMKLARTSTMASQWTRLFPLLCGPQSSSVKI